MSAGTLTAANLCAAMYQDKSDGYWDHWWEKDGVTVGHKVLDGVHHFVPRGSKALRDWVRDIAAAPVYRADVGFIHGGFGFAADEVIGEILGVVRTGDAIEFYGHSLGAAEASIYAGILAVRQVPVSAVYLFGCPRPGYEQLQTIVNKWVPTKESWRNAGDPVPLLPAPIPIVLPYCWAIQPGMFNEPYAPSDADDLFRSHHINLYQTGAADV